MHPPSRSKQYFLNSQRIIWIVLALWTIILAASVTWNVIHLKRWMTEIAHSQARYAVKKDLSFRRWNTLHGGVYVPVTPTTPPNPYLDQIPDRDIRLPSGRLFTMVNPAYMMRQVYEQMKKDSGILGHITSLNPIRPQNTPDAWEAKALKAFAQGKTQVSSMEKIEGQAFLRHMEPLVTEKACLACHARQGYREGDIRGGISVSIPLAPLKAIERLNMMWLIPAHVVLWMIVSGGLVWGALRIRRSEGERRQMEEALQASERKYRSIFENAVEGMFQSSPEGFFLSVNEAMARMHGYESPEAMIKGITNLSRQLYVYPTDRDRYKKILEEQGRVENFEAQFRKKDGTVFWTCLNARIVRDEAGNIRYFEGIVQDITERKEAEAKLLTYSQEIADLYNSAPCGYHSLDPDGTFLNLNDMELEWLGVTREEVVGRKKLRDFLTPDSRIAFGEYFQVLLKQGWVKDLEYDLIRQDGTVFPVVVNSKIVKDGEGNFIMTRATMFNMTNLKRAQEELRRLNDTLEERVEARTEEMKKARRAALSMMQDAEIERERTKQILEKLNQSTDRIRVLSNAVDQSPSSVVITTREGLIEYVNPKFELLTGYTFEEVKGKTPRILKSGVHPEAVYKTLWETILSGKEWHGELCNKKKTGELYWERSSISALRNEAGEISNFISVREDVSEQKRLDEELNQRMKELERFTRLTINREEKMIELKEEINELLVKMGGEKKYKIVE